MPITQFEGKALVFNNGVVDVQQDGVSVVDENKVAHITPGEMAIDELTIIKNADQELEVPFDNDSIYRDENDGFIKAKSGASEGFVEERVRTAISATEQLRVDMNSEFSVVMADMLSEGRVNEMIDIKISGKQDQLTAGDNITITNNVISASGGSGGLDSEGVIALNSREYSLNKKKEVTYSGNDYFEDDWLYSNTLFNLMGAGPGRLQDGPSDFEVDVIDLYQEVGGVRTKDAYMGYPRTVGPWENAKLSFNRSKITRNVTDPSPSLPSGMYCKIVYSAGFAVDGTRPGEYDYENLDMVLLCHYGDENIDASYITFANGQDNPWTIKLRVDTGIKKDINDQLVLIRNVASVIEENATLGVMSISSYTSSDWEYNFGTVTMNTTALQNAIIQAINNNYLPMIPFFVIKKAIMGELAYTFPESFEFITATVSGESYNGLQINASDTTIKLLATSDGIPYVQVLSN